jgi:hypothetical protein
MPITPELYDELIEAVRDYSDEPIPDHEQTLAVMCRPVTEFTDEDLYIYALETRGFEMLIGLLRAQGAITRSLAARTLAAFRDRISECEAECALG